MASNLILPRSVWRRLLRREEGMYSAVQLVVLLFFALMAVFFFQMVLVTQTKVHWQNAADASARAAATGVARGMNALCVTNHLIGESVAMLIVHEAVAGPTPGSNGRSSDEDGRLDSAYRRLRVVRSVPPGTKPSVIARWKRARNRAKIIAYDTVKQTIRAEAMVRDAKRILKKELARVYQTKAAAVYAYAWSGSGAFLQQIDAANRREEQIEYEYQVLNTVEAAAASVRPANERLKGVTIPELRRYTERLRRDAPAWARGLAEAVAEENGVRVALTPATPPLPIVKDPLAAALDNPSGLDQRVPASWYDPAASRQYFSPPSGPGGKRVGVTPDQIVKVTQLARAAFPWVIYHREPMLRYLNRKNLTISGAEKLYFDETAGTAKQMLKTLQQSGGLLAGGLDVLRRSTLPDKGFQRWTNDPADLADLFAVTCRVVSQDATGKPDGGAEWLFRKILPAQPTATATAMLYNGLPQQPHSRRIDLATKRITPWRQPKTGWDTLQWKPHQEPTDPGASDWENDNGMPFELVGAGSVLDARYVPRVETSWQARLAPVAPGAPSAGDDLLRGHAAIVTH